MVRLPGNKDRDFSTSQSKDDGETNIAELFASRPPSLDEFLDTAVQIRIAMLITRAMNKPTKP